MKTSDNTSALLVDGEDTNCRVNNEYGKKNEQEEDPVPAWMRYMPRKKYKINQPEGIRSEENTEHADDARKSERVLGLVRPSSNRFGPTSSRAMTENRKKRARRDTESSDGALDENDSASAAFKSTQSSIQKKSPTKRSRNIPNMEEAAMLFAFCDMKKGPSG